MRRSVTGLVLLGTTFSLVPMFAPTSAPPAAAVGDQSPDFNGDGYADLAVGAADENNNRGVVHVLYGSASGPSGTGSIVFGEDTPGVPGTAAPNDYFGYFIAHGNINGDAYDDLVVANPSDAVAGKANAGSVTLFRGSASGLNLQGRLFTDSFGPGTVRADEFFGNGIALGDFDGNGTDDIAIGTPLDDNHLLDNWSGRVKILRSLNGGFSESRVWMLSRNNLPTPYRSNFTLGFGNTLATIRGEADFDGLALGIAGYSNTVFAQGAVVTFRGGSTSMRYADFFQGPHGTETVYGGTAISAGDISGDGNDDLAIGVPDAANGQGRVDVIPLGRDRRRLRSPIQMSSSDGGHAPASQDGFGFSVAIVDDAANAYLYVGAPWDEVGGRVNGGSTYIFEQNGNNKPKPHSTARITQPAAVRNGSFGFQITTLDASNDGFADIVISSFHTVGGHETAGAVWYYDSDDGTPFVGTPVQYNQDTPGVPDRAEDGDAFGGTLAYR